LELLENADAPQHIKKEGIVALILSASGGIAILVLTLITWLKKKAWNLDNDVLNNLMTGEPIQNIQTTINRRLSILLNNNSKELIYKTSCIIRL